MIFVAVQQLANLEFRNSFSEFVVTYLQTWSSTDKQNMNLDSLVHTIRGVPCHLVDLQMIRTPNRVSLPLVTTIIIEEGLNISVRIYLKGWYFVTVSNYLCFSQIFIR